MPITNDPLWQSWVEANTDPYGKCCIDVAREVMRRLDAKQGPFDPRLLVNDADKAIKAGGITGAMAGFVASMVAQVHSRGEEFRRAWNRETQIGTEGDEANAKGKGTLNPAFLRVGKKA